MTTTTEILNGATSIQSRIDTVLTAEDHQLDWTVDTDWMPGDPIYSSPGCTPRRMVDLLESRTIPARCEPCQVRWTGDDPCWVCGEDRPRLISPLAGGVSMPRAAMASLFVAVDVSPIIDALTRMAESLARIDLEPFQRYWLNSYLTAIPRSDAPLVRPTRLPIDGHAYARRRRSRRTR